MIIDAADIEAGQCLHADLCIVGAGAAGIAIALQFLAGPVSVLLIESGGVAREPDADALNGGHVTDPAMHSPTSTYRRRGLGGSTRIWGGRCVPFDAIDFEPRPWMPHSGWPIRLADLRPFYPPANALCEAGEFAYDADQAFPDGLAPIIQGLRGPHFTDARLERFSCPTDFGRRYHRRLANSRSVRVLLRATIIELLAGTNGTAIDLLRGAGTLTGRPFTVRARAIVLALGGLEIPRLLLASRRHHAAGIGNAGGAVGRFYMCHVAGTTGRLRLRAGVSHGYAIAADGTYCRRRLTLTAAAQRGLGAGNIAVRLHHPRIADAAHRTGALSALYLARPFISYEYGRRLADPSAAPLRDWLRHAATVARDPLGTASFLLHWVGHRTLAARKLPSVVVVPRGGEYSLDFHAEQAPNPDSRITLTTDPDRLGLPRILVDWRPSAIDTHTVRSAVQALGNDIERSGCGTLHCAPEAAGRTALRDGAYGGHHIGTARMSPTPRQGVVDAECRVHGMHNLFIAGSAVFPTSSQANPTLTIVALALRLAAQLRREAVLF